MNHDNKDFGELYRAAFAERDPDTKVVLLGEVRKAIDEWERVLQTYEEKPSTSRHEPHQAAARSAMRVA